MAQKSDMDGGIKIYLREIGKTDLLTPDQEVELAERIKKGDPEARSHMIRANLRLVVKIAQDYANYGLPLLDLISEGNIGLMKAVERFDPNKGGKLSTYAAWWIKQSIKRALANQSKTIRLPVHMVDKLSKMRRVAMSMSEELGREPTDEELSDEIGIDRGKLSQLKAAGMRPASLDAPISEGDPTEFGEIVGDPNAIDAGAHLMSKDDHSKMLPLLDCLDPRERDILERRYGLNGHTAQTLEEVGLVYEVTRERIRQLQNIAIKKLRKRLRDLNNPLKRKIQAENDEEGDKKTPKSTILNSAFLAKVQAQLAASAQVKKAPPETLPIQPSAPVPVKSSPVIPVISSAVTSILTSVTSQGTSKGLATVHLDKKPITDPHVYSPYRKVLVRDLERAGRKSELRKLLAMEMSDAITQLGKIVLENVFFSGDDGSPEQATWESIARPMAQYRFGDDVPEITGKEVFKIVAEIIGVSYPVIAASIPVSPKPQIAVVEMNQVIDETTVANLYHKLRRMDMTLPIHLDAALSARLVSLASALVGKQREIILLRYFNTPDQAQFTQQQVAHMLGMSNQTIVSINERAALASILEQISSDLKVPVPVPVPVISERLSPEKNPDSPKNRLIIKCYRGDGDVLAIEDFHELGHPYGLTGYQVVQRLFWTKTVSRDRAKQMIMNGEHGLAKKDERFIEELLI